MTLPIRPDLDRGPAPADDAAGNLVPALIAIQAVALSARAGQLTLHMVDDARARAEQLLPPGHPALTAMLSFATMYELHRRDDDQMRKQGEYLQDALGRALNPDAVAPRRMPYAEDRDDG